MMTTLDFAPLYRSSVGFDHLFDLLESAGRAPAADNWPSYDIVKLDEDSYRITMAVAGFSEDDLTVTQEPNLLVVRGSTKGSADANYLHRGIAGRDFERRFELADHVKVNGASLENGLLTIDLMREIPEAMKPRRIAIGSGNAPPMVAPPQLEGRNEAA